MAGIRSRGTFDSCSESASCACFTEVRVARIINNIIPFNMVEVEPTLVQYAFSLCMPGAHDRQAVYHRARTSAHGIGTCARNCVAFIFNAVCMLARGFWPGIRVNCTYF